MYCCWPIYLRIFGIVASPVMDSILHIIIHYRVLRGTRWNYSRHFELLTDVDMVLFIEGDIGSKSMFKQVCIANNKFMQLYYPSKPSTYLMYFDGNNLYGWAMCQPLPYTDFHWIDVDNFDVISITTDSPTGYILEMDLEYPQHLHDAHSDLPFCPKKPPGKREKNSSRHCMIKSVTSYIITICSNVFITVSAL